MRQNCTILSCRVGRSFATGSFLALTLVLASGCAMFGGADPEPRFATLAVVTQGQSDVDLEADSTTKSAMVGGGAGVVSGAVVGAGAGAATGIGGGPLAPLTMILGAGVGGALGAATGATAGVIIGGLQGLPSEKAEQVTRILAGLPQTRDFQEELRSAVEATRCRRAAEAASDRADATAILQLTQLELEQHLSDEISLRLRAKMTLEWGPEPRGPRFSELRLRVRDAGPTRRRLAGRRWRRLRHELHRRHRHDREPDVYRPLVSRAAVNNQASSHGWALPHT